MRSISARYIVRDAKPEGISGVLGGTRKFILRVYIPPECYSGPNIRLVVMAFKNGVRRFTKALGLPVNRLEKRSKRSHTLFDIGLNSAEARVVECAVDPHKEDDTEIWVLTYPANPSTYGGALPVGQAGEVFKADVTRGDRVFYGIDTNSDDAPRVGTRRSVRSPLKLPSRNLRYRNGTNDAQPKVRTSLSRVTNELSAYETDISVAYYYVNMSTIRVVLMNLPPGFSRLQVTAQRSGDDSYSSSPIRRVDESQATESSSYFFAGQSEDGNGFTRAGGYIVFDLQIRVDARNGISHRVNDAEQNFFLNLRNVNGDLISDNPRSALPMFSIPTVHAGQYANIRLRMLGGVGLERAIDVGETIGTMAYQEPRVDITSSPVRLSDPPTTARLMAAIAPTSANASTFNVDLSSSGARSSDVFIDLGINYVDLAASASGIADILESYRNGEPIIAGRHGTSFIIANVKRFDSITGTTMDLGVFSVDKFIDKVSDPADEKSVAALVGAQTRSEFADRANDHGLILIYTAEFYELSPEMIAAFMSMESPDDATAAELFSNVTNSRSFAGIRLLNYINEITKSRTPLRQVALQVEYKQRFRPQPQLAVSRAESLQSETNIPYNYVECSIKREAAEYAAFVEVERVLSDTHFSGVTLSDGLRFGEKRESIGFLPLENGKVAFRDFVPPDMVNILNGGSERLVQVKYNLYTYDYVWDNGLVGNRIRRRSEPLVVTPQIL